MLAHRFADSVRRMDSIPRAGQNEIQTSEMAK